MKRIVLHGLFKKLAVESFSAKINSFEELIGSIYANFEGFNVRLRRFCKNVNGFLVVVDNKVVDNLNLIDEKIRRGKVIELVPICKLNAYTSITIAFTSIAAQSLGQAIAYSVINIIILTALSVGISYLTTKLLSPKQPKQVKTASYIFSSKENAVERNVPIPLNYGRLRLGTNVIGSAGFAFDIGYVPISNNIQSIVQSGGGISSGMIVAQI